MQPIWNQINLEHSINFNTEEEADIAVESLYTGAATPEARYIRATRPPLPTLPEASLAHLSAEEKAVALFMRHGEIIHKIQVRLQGQEKVKEFFTPSGGALSLLILDPLPHEAAENELFKLFFTVATPSGITLSRFLP